MKKIIILLNLFLISLSVLAGGGCDGEIMRFTNPRSPIEYWGTHYQSCEYYEWSIMTPDDWSYIEIDYVIDLNPTGAIDALLIYATDTTGQEREVLNYSYQPMVGRITLPLYTPGIRIVFVSEYGNEGGLYKGLKLNYREGSANPSDQVFFSNVGIGTYPKETLHVNGAIRGGGTNGEVTLKGDNGYVTIGATSQAMEFVTNKSQFVFNKPIYNQSGIYNVQNSNLLVNINNLTRMTILQNSGNVGIGILNPSTRLHINDGALKIGLSTSASERLKNILQFGNEDFVQIGEWEQDDYLSFKARGYNFIYGDVGIGVSDPQYRLDVAGTVHAYNIITDGTIRASEIIVNTTGADFVFADDYQLRPLSEVKTFIQENKHLPEIKSAQEMQEDGVRVNELQTQLLQKIEELTLYLIQQEQTIQELRQEVEQLKK